jgi:hypothetical protein
MSGFPDYSARKILDHVVGKTSFTMPTSYIALFTALPSDANAGGTEVSGNAYARKQTAGADWNAAGGSAPASISNANSLSFPTASGGDWAPLGTPVIGWGLFDAASAGNPLFFDYMGAFDWLPFSTVDAAGDTIQCPAHGVGADDRVVFSAEFGGTLPAGLTGGTLYYVRSGGLTTDAFTVSTTSGGAAVNITGNGMGMVRKVLPKVIQNGDTPSFAAGQLVIKAA